MYASIRRYQMDRGSVDELMQRVEEGFVPIISQTPGFIAYYAIDAGDGVVASISIFEDQTGAEESNRRAGGWVQEYGAALLPNAPQTTAREVLVSKTTYSTSARILCVDCYGVRADCGRVWPENPGCWRFLG